MALSYTNYTGDGSTTDFNVVFDYISRDHIHVYIANEETSDFTWFSDTVIRLDSAAGTNGLVIKLKRLTPNTARLVDFQNGSVVDADRDLDADSNQLFYLMQEAYDNTVAGQIIGPVGPKGDDGAQGDPGTPGDDGAQGDPGVSIASYTGEVPTPIVFTHKLELYSPVAGTIDHIKTILVAGTCTVKLKINTVDVTGSNHGATTSIGTGTCTAANTIAIGDLIELDVSAPSGAQGLSFSVKVTLL